MFPLSTTSVYSRHEEATATVPAAPEALFERLDDQAKLAGHMEKPSAMMMGGTMAYRFDERRGRDVGGLIWMTGSIPGLRLSVEEIITERLPPRRKVWETRGRVRLLVVGPYRMGFEISPLATGSQLTVFIDYDLPKGPLTYLLGLLFGRMYARWCVQTMVADAAKG